MSGNAKTRFVIHVDGELRQVFSVQEQANGDLAINSTPAENFENPANIRIIRDKCTVHRSQNSGLSGTTVTHKTFLDGDRVQSYAAFINGPKDKLLWLTRAAIPPTLKNDKYIGKIRQKDKLVDLGYYKSDINGLAYATVIASPTVQLPELPTCLNTTIASFRNFQVACYYAFTSFPQESNGKISICATSIPIIDGVKIDNNKYSGVETLSGERLIFMICKLFSEMARQLCFIPQGFSISPDGLAHFLDYSILFKEPVNNIHELYQKLRNKKEIILSLPDDTLSHHNYDIKHD